MTTTRRVLSALLLIPTPSFAQKTELLVTVPFVGCPADGQTGPLDPPQGHLRQVHIPAETAAHLAWYQASGDVASLGTLAPRGWHCFATYGSSGESLYVAPETLDADKLIFGKNWHGFTGPAIQLSVSIGDTSGRFEVAHVIARVFPTHHTFAKKVMAEHFDPPSDYRFAPFPTDKLVYKSTNLVEFTTPAHADGLGTMSRLTPGDNPIHGLASLDVSGDMSLTQLNVRLPAEIEFLAPILVDSEEQNLRNPKTH